MIGRLHEPTGAGYRLLTANTPFDQYITAARKLIAEHRVDLNSTQASKIIEANSPFEWRPYQSERYQRGVLLVHGLFDCPFRMRDMAAHFLKQGFLVRAILLPGHGTVPGDLLYVHRNDWLDTLENAITSTAAIVDDFYLCGFSLGAALSLLKWQQAKNLRGMILFAPGLKSRNPKAPLTKIFRLFTWISKKAKWYQISKQIDYTKYNSHSYNPAYQTYMVMKEASKIRTTVPLFFIASEDDETIDTNHVIDFFKQQPNPQNRMILYTKNPSKHHANIEERCSVYPERNIIDFSHTCIPVSPNNAYLGEHGELLDFSHYHNEDEQKHKEIRIGAITANNLLHFTMQRLSYNPDFDHMVQCITHFVEELDMSPSPRGVIPALE
jgi:esterase/lipase